MKLHYSFWGLALLLMSPLCLAQTRSGQVTDENNLPLPGATVIVEGTSRGTTTDFDGNYQIEAQSGDVLLFSYVGYADQQMTVGAADRYDVQMSLDNELEEVVVTALGSVKENRAVGYAVQSVDGERVNQANETNIINALQGQIAGVQIQGSPSTLGGSSRITIRGSNSFLGNNQPLFVVDGVPINNSNFASSGQQRGFGGGTYDYGNMAADIDPGSIQNMSVLKGAAATALYGSRGANGVILITTKTGAIKKGIGVTVNSNITFDSVTNLIPMQQTYGGGSINADTPHGFSEFTQNGTTYLYPNYAKDGSWGPKYNPNVRVRHWDSWDPNAPNYQETRPWVAPKNDYTTFFDTGVTHNHSVALAGSNEEGNFRLGYTKLNQKGTIPGGVLNRNTLNLSSGYQLTEGLKTGVSFNYVNTEAENRNVTGYNGANPMQAFTQWWQTQLDIDRLRKNQNTSLGDQYTWNAKGPIVNSDTNELIRYDFAPNYFDNPFWSRENLLQEDTRNRIFGNANLSYQINPNLQVYTQFGLDWYQFSLREGIPHRSVDQSSYGEVERRFQETNFEARINYQNSFFDAFDFNVMLGANRMKQLVKRSSRYTSGGLVIDRFFNIANSKNSPTTQYPHDNSKDINEKGINSVFGSMTIGWNEMVYLDLAARNDWSSTLPENSNSYFYPSASLSFAFSELLGDFDFLNFGKVRASIAQAGNDADPYRLVDVFEPRTPNFGNNPLYRVPQSRQNPNLVNELTTEYEFGLNVRLFDNKLFLDMAYYDRTTKDQIFNVDSPAPTGYTSRLLNAGEMRNWGWEFEISGTPIQKNEFRWDVGLNLTAINNEVVSLLKDENGNSVVENINMGSTWAAQLRIQEGYPYMAVFGNDYTYDRQGNRIVDENGIYKFTDERVYLGSAIADFTGGFNTSFSYRNFNLGALFDFQIGGIIHSTSLQWSKYSGMHPETVSFNGESDTRANGMVLPGVLENGNPNTKRIEPQNYYQTQWRMAAPNIYDASFLKFRELRLSYNFPQNISQYLSLNDLSLSFFGRNLAILAADLPYLDPQVVTGAGNRQGLENAQVPSTRSFGINLVATF